MDRMSVTLDVSQLDMSALNWAKPAKSPLIFVSAETPQLEKGRSKNEVVWGVMFSGLVRLGVIITRHNIFWLQRFVD